MDEGGLGRGGARHGVEPVAGRGASTGDQTGVPRSQLPVQGHAVQVGADHAQLHPPLRLPQIQGRPAGRWFRSRKSPGQVQKGGVGPGRCDQADPEARTIGPEARRDGDGRQVQEVHEVGVEAKVGVEGEGLREDLGNAVDGPGGRQDQNVCGAPDGFGGAGAGGEGVLSLVGLDSREPCSRLDNGPDDRMNGGGVPGQQVLHRRRALGHVGTRIEQTGRLQKGCDVDLDDVAVEALEGGPVKGGGLRIPQEVELVGAGNPISRSARKGGVPDRTREVVPGVETRCDGVDPPGEGGVCSEDADAVQGPAGGNQPLGAPPAPGRLEAHQTIEGRRHPA